MCDLAVCHIPPEVSVLRKGLLHVPDQLFIVARVFIQPLQRRHHHAGAVIVIIVKISRKLRVLHPEQLQHRVFVREKAARIGVDHRLRDLVVGINDALLVADIQRVAADQPVGRDLTRALQIVIVHIERHLIGARREHQPICPKAVALPAAGIIIGDREIVLVQPVFRAEALHEPLQRLLRSALCGHSSPLLRAFAIRRPYAAHRRQQHRHKHQRGHTAQPFQQTITSKTADAMSIAVLAKKVNRFAPGGRRLVIRRTVPGMHPKGTAFFTQKG